MRPSLPHSSGLREWLCGYVTLCIYMSAHYVLDMVHHAWLVDSQVYAELITGMKCSKPMTTSRPPAGAGREDISGMSCSSDKNCTTLLQVQCPPMHLPGRVFSSALSRHETSKGAAVVHLFTLEGLTMHDH